MRIAVQHICQTSTPRRRIASRIDFSHDADNPVTFNKEKPESRFRYGHFANQANRRKFMDDLAAHLGFTQLNDFYRIKASDVFDFGGRNLILTYHGSSVKNAVKEIYPEHDWDDSKFVELKKEWENKDLIDHRRTFDEIGKKLDVKNMDDWYRVTGREIAQLGFSGILQGVYGGVLLDAMVTVYPEHNWQFWKFQGRHNWDEESNIRKYLDWASKELLIESLDDWYSVSRRQIGELGGARLIDLYTNIPTLMREFYPEHNWDTEKFRFDVRSPDSRLHPRKNQVLLFKRVKQIFPFLKDVTMEYRHPDLVFEDSGISIEFDVFAPSISLAFEYQGEQHYGKYGRLRGNAPARDQIRDSLKKAACQKANITLIEVPYWWNLGMESLLGSIHAARPDLVANPKRYRPIPKINPHPSGSTRRKFSGSRMEATS